MVRTKKCDDKMTCEGSGCILNYKFNPYFIYGRTINFIGHSCRVDKLVLYSNDLTKKMFKNTQSKCLPRDLYCVTNEFTVIWSESIIHECPFQLVKQMKLNNTGDIWYSDQER